MAVNEIVEFEATTSEQDNFYESSVKWVESLKARHDPYDFFGILENNVQKYPYQAIDNSLILAARPNESLAETEKKDLADQLLAKMTREADVVMGEGAFDRLVADLGRLSVLGGDPGSALRAVWGRLSTPRHNTASVAYHPNIMALPIYSIAMAKALSKMELPNFDLFEFNERNLLPVNPALSIASFKGEPLFEYLSFSTIIKTIPPTRSALNYGMDRIVQRKMVAKADKALTDYLEANYARGRSIHATIDPTASTFEPIIECGQLTAVRRNAISSPVRRMILEKFNYALPMTMRLNGSATNWWIGRPIPLTGGDFSGPYFDEAMNELDRETAEIYGVPLVIKAPERAIGKTALER